MNRSLPIINFAGVVALGILCLFQWQTNRRANLETIGLEKEKHGLTATVVEQTKTIEGLKADLNSFREQLAKAGELAGNTTSQLRSAEKENSGLRAERDQLKTNVSAWSDAVAKRDKQLSEANETIKQLATTRDEAIEKFNALAQKHNDLIKDFNDLNRQLAAARTNSTPVAK
jgi:chromosome segregation ATPase